MTYKELKGVPNNDNQVDSVESRETVRDVKNTRNVPPNNSNLVPNVMSKEVNEQAWRTFGVD